MVEKNSGLAPHRHPQSPIAVVDVGSNSLCLLIAMVLRSGRMHEVQKLKDVARLRDELGADGVLAEAGIVRLLRAMTSFAAVIEDFGADVRVVATATLRAARNADEVVRRIFEATGLGIEVISGDDEARLAFLGVLEGMGATAGDVVCADVGGGSTELVLGRDGRILHTASVPIGALVVAREWLGPDPVTPESVARARAGIAKALADDLAPFRNRPELQGIATSGTIQRVARIAAALSGQPRVDVDRMALDRAHFAVVLDALQAAQVQEERLRIPGMDPSRADSLLGGALIHAAIADALELPAWTVSMSGLRTGVLADLRNRGAGQATGIRARS
jgi:exopolyphosphatase/guanosine-5'-triphosphate,3'-diphosphate pyrophosphatase